MLSCGAVVYLNASTVIHWCLSSTHSCQTCKRVPLALLPNSIVPSCVPCFYSPGSLRASLSFVVAYAAVVRRGFSFVCWHRAVLKHQIGQNCENLSRGTMAIYTRIQKWNPSVVFVHVSIKKPRANTLWAGKKGSTQVWITQLSDFVTFAVAWAVTIAPVIAVNAFPSEGSCMACETLFWFVCQPIVNCLTIIRRSKMMFSGRFDDDRSGANVSGVSKTALFPLENRSFDSLEKICSCARWWHKKDESHTPKK